MRILTGSLIGAALITLVGCNSAPKSEKQDAAGSATAWPTELKVVGDGYPASGDACRRIGESAATSDYLDDSATLVGCLSKSDAEKLGGKIVGSVKGVTLVSVPGMANSSLGDAKVAGTNYNATAQIECSGYRDHPAGRCRAGVERNAAGGLTHVDITWPKGDSRTLHFDKAGKVVGANTNEADGSSRFPVIGKRVEDNTVVTIGPERYVVPDAFVQGG